MSIIYHFKEYICGFKMIPKAWFYLSFWQSYEWLCVHILEAVNPRKMHQKFIYSPWWY